MTVLGAIFLLVAIASALTRRHVLPWLLSAASTFASSVAIAGGSNGASPFFMFAMLAAVIVVVRYLLVDFHWAQTPGRRCLIGFTAWSTVITVAGPVLFAGIGVLSSRAGIDSQIDAPSALTFTVSNLAQIIYLLLGVAIVAYLARSAPSPNLLGLGFALGTVLSALRWVSLYLFQFGWPSSLFDNSPAIRYVDFTDTGERRLRGIFSEPSALATFSLVSIAFFASLFCRTKGWRRAGCAVMIGLAILNLSGAQAGTTVAGGLLLLAVAAVVGFHRLLVSRGAGAGIKLVVIPAAAGVIVWQWHSIYSALHSAVIDKLGSNSYAARSSSSAISFHVLVKTWGLGAGLGSNRPSSFYPALLSCVGVIGTVLFVCAAVFVLRSAWSRPQLRPTAWALLAGLLLKGFVGGVLSDPGLWMCLGVCAAYCWRPRTEPAPAVEVVSSSPGQMDSMSPRPLVGLASYV